MDTQALIDAMYAHGLRYPGTVEGISCAGTAIEARTVKVKKRAFVFVRLKDARLKLGDSLSEAKAMAAAAPDQYEASDNGWVKIVFDRGAAPGLDVMRRWIDESYRLMASKTLLKQLDAEPVPLS